MVHGWTLKCTDDRTVSDEVQNVTHRKNVYLYALSSMANLWRAHTAHVRGMRD